MRVIIVGASKVGYALVRHVSREGHDVVVIDRDPERIDAITDAFDCNGYVGNGSSPELLKRAGIASASLLVAVTKQDETNILCCNVAKKLGVTRTIAAVRGPEYSKDKKFLTNDMGVDLVVNPDKAAAREVNKLIRYAGSVEIERFADGSVNVATVDIADGSIIDGVKMMNLQSVIGAQLLVCAIERKGRIITPRGDSEIKSGDRITFAAIGGEMDKALKQLGIIEKLVKNTVIVGGGRIGYYLTRIMLEQGVKVTLIEKSAENCQQLLEIFPKANIVNGDGTDSELMESVLHGADACVAVTSSDEENLIISMFARSCGLERIAAEIDNDNYAAMLKKSGINHIFSTQDVALGGVIKNARTLATGMSKETDNEAMKWLHTLNSGKIEAAEFEINKDFKLTGIEFKSKQFTLKKGVLIAVIIREQGAIVPDGNSVLMQGDRIVVVSAEDKISRLSDIVA